jgi:alkylation response protein AidB-like acyl-CoA dehydrogenase
MSAYFTTPRHHELRGQVRLFADSEVSPRVGDMEASRTVDHELSRLIARQGWIGATIDAE